MRSEDDMSGDIYAKPDMAKKVCARQGEKVERIVDIYVSADSLRGLEPGSGIQEATQRKPGERDKMFTKNSVGVAAVCLGLLCVLLLAGILGIAIHFYSDRSSLTEEISQLKANSSNLTNEKELLQTSYNNLTKERDQLQTINQNLTKDLHVMKEMTNSIQWYKLVLSWYYVSTELKTWNESRQDCLSRRADLVVINSREEEAFIVSLFNKRVWIGLTDIKFEGTWKWVDGTLLNNSLSFWYSPQPDNGGRPSIGEEDCAEIYNSDYYGPVNRWNDLSCGWTNFWICEKDIFNQHL